MKRLHSLLFPAININILFPVSFKNIMGIDEVHQDFTELFWRICFSKKREYLLFWMILYYLIKFLFKFRYWIDVFSDVYKLSVVHPRYFYSSAQYSRSPPKNLIIFSHNEALSNKPPPAETALSCSSCKIWPPLGRASLAISNLFILYPAPAARSNKSSGSCPPPTCFYTISYRMF